MMTQEKLKELFEYDSNGGFIRKTSGKPVEVKITKGRRYSRVGINGNPYALHRMIFLWHYGYLPKILDHIDGSRLNNKIENLREVTQSQNCLNRKHHSNSKSPYKNVYLQSPTKKSEWKRNWVVSITVEDKRKYIGSFEDLELADLVATEARDKYHGKYAKHF